MRWVPTRRVIMWGLAGVAAVFAVLCPLSRWLWAGWFGPAGKPAVNVAMGGEQVVINVIKGPPPMAPYGPKLWWKTAPVSWAFWFHYRSYPTVTQLVIPLWPLAVVPGAAAFLLWRGELPARRRRLGQCVKCGYDRRGIDPAAACPECGAVASV